MRLDQIDAFLEMMNAERGASALTIESYRRDLVDFSGFLSSREVSFVKAVSADIEEYMRTVARQSMSAKTQSRRLSAIREFYRFLYSEGLIHKNPTDYILSPKIGHSLPKYLTEREIKVLIETAEQKDERLYVMLELLYASGMRVSELVCLPVQAVTRDNPTMTIIGKGAKERLVPLNDVAIKALDRWLVLRENYLKNGRVSKWMFPSVKGKSGHLTRDGFFKLLKDIAMQAGIDSEKVSPHVFRHSFASHLIAHDADLRTVQQMLGHADIATTEIYTHILQDRLKKTVEKSHPLAYSTQKG